MNFFKKNKVQDNSQTRKDFNYSKGICNLKFILRTDIKSELRDFLELLKVAQKDVEKELEQYGNY